MSPIFIYHNTCHTFGIVLEFSHPASFALCTERVHSHYSALGDAHAVHVSRCASLRLLLHD